MEFCIIINILASQLLITEAVTLPFRNFNNLQLRWFTLISKFSMSECLCQKHRQIFLYIVNQTSQDYYKYRHDGKSNFQQIKLHIHVCCGVLSLIN